MNPVEEFLEEFGTKKEAAAEWIPRGLGALNQVAQSDSLRNGLATAGAGAVIGGVAGAANQVYTAMTKKRDFKAMMDFDPGLADLHAENPGRFNQLYTSLRAANQHFGSDPVIAANYMRQMAENPQHAGGILAENVFPKRKEVGAATRQNPVQRFGEDVMGGFRGKAGKR